MVRLAVFSHLLHLSGTSLPHAINTNIKIPAPWPTSTGRLHQPRLAYPILLYISRGDAQRTVPLSVRTSFRVLMLHVGEGQPLGVVDERAQGVHIRRTGCLPLVERPSHSGGDIFGESIPKRQSVLVVHRHRVPIVISP